MAALSQARTAPVAPPLPRSLLAGYHGPAERHLGGSGPVQDHEALRAPGLTGTPRSPAVTRRTGASSLQDRAEHPSVPIPFRGSGGVVIPGLSDNVSLSGRLRRQDLAH
ncbi:hypothetical protein ACIP3U_12945 [[Kitasatospora] papulosa]|uniref:hypothetical protein n=1 Tax=[Kitasatospora] papulosa TaxID=1464011 RepID=UPI00381B909E